MIWHTEKRKVNSLIPYINNPRKLTKKQDKDLKQSLGLFNLAEIPVINTDNTILAGHQRLKILQDLGRGNEEIDVRVPDKLLSDAQVQEYNIRSNKNTGSWDMGILEKFDTQKLISWGFGINELSRPVQEKEKYGKEFTEEDCKEDSESIKNFLLLKKKATARSKDLAETSYYAAIVFNSYEQKQEFFEFIDKDREHILYNCYIDGEYFAKKFCVPITQNTQGPVKSIIEKKLADMVKIKE